MLSAFRAFAKSWFAIVVIFGGLLISFGIAGNNGVRDAFSTNFGTWIVAAGQRKVQAAEFKDFFDGIKSQQEQRAQQQIPLEMAVQMGLDRAVLNEMEGRTAVAEFLKRIGVRPDIKLVEDQIKKYPAFFNPVTREFDKKTYAELLARNNLTPERFQTGLSEDIAFNHFAFGVGIGMRLPRAYTAPFAAMQTESRDSVYFVIDPRTVGGVKPPTDAELNDFIAKRKIMLPEMRVISVVRFRAQDVAANVKIDEADVRKVYDFRKDSLSTPEKRSLIQIPVKDQATAAAVSARLKKGEDPTAVAHSLKVEPLPLDDRPKSSISDRRVADVAFSLPDGAVSGPIQGDLSWSVVKVTGITPGKEMSFEEARPEIEKDLKQKGAEKLAYDQSDKYDKAHSTGVPLAEAAKQAGVTPTTFGPVSKEGMGPDYKPVQGTDPKVLEAAFGLPAGGESDLVDAGNGEWFAVKVEKVVPPAPPNLDLIRGELTKGLMEQTLKEKLEAKAKELRDRIKKGESLEAVAASVGATVVHVTGVDQASAQNHLKDLGQDYLQNLFQARAGDLFVARAPDNKAALMIGRVDAVREGDLQDTAKVTEALRPRLGMSYFGELRTGFTDAAKAATHSKSDLNRARAAIGMSADDIAKNDPKAKGKGKGDKPPATP